MAWRLPWGRPQLVLGVQGEEVTVHTNLCEPKWGSCWNAGSARATFGVLQPTSDGGPRNVLLKVPALMQTGWTGPERTPVLPDI